jgi:hypothetical protein
MALPISGRKLLLKASSLALDLMQGHPRASEELANAISPMAKKKQTPISKTLSI